MKITVNPRKGEPNDCARCPVALAIVEQVADVEFVEVDGETVTLQCVCSPKRVFTLPLAVQNFIALIDDGQAGRLGELSFELDL